MKNSEKSATYIPENTVLLKCINSSKFIEHMTSRLKPKDFLISLPNTQHFSVNHNALKEPFSQNTKPNL